MIILLAWQHPRTPYLRCSPACAGNASWELPSWSSLGSFADSSGWARWGRWDILLWPIRRLLVCCVGNAYCGGRLISPSRFADRSSRHIYLESRQKAPLIQRCPYMHLLPARHAADTREPAFHLGRAGVMLVMHSKVWSIADWEPTFFESSSPFAGISTAHQRWLAR